MFKVGDTVRLKSGGRLMTVTGIGNDENKGQMVWTSWFVNNKEDKGHYPASSLDADDGADDDGADSV
jgi:uncharacterized protein YodC (DUF2158 family)